MSAVLTLSNLHKSYPSGESRLEVLKGFDLTINAGEIVALVGPSGCGKTTLLQLAGLLDTPDSGEVVLGGENAKQNDRIRTKLRLKYLGFVYQFHHLLPEFSALENVMLPQLITGTSKKEARTRAEKLLGDVGLSARLNHRPAQLSGGEQQRVAIARALSNKPKLLLADEPTGNLDPETADAVFNGFMQYVKAEGCAVLLVTHNPELAKKVNRIISLTK